MLFIDEIKIHKGTSFPDYGVAERSQVLLSVPV